MKIILVLLLFLLPLSSYAVEVGDKAPDFNATTLDGREIHYFSAIKDKKPLYLIFWATW